MLYDMEKRTLDWELEDLDTDLVQAVPLTSHHTQELGFFICIPQAAVKSLN